MKILFAAAVGEDMGGIIPATENCMAALKELGHSISFALLRNTKQNGDNGDPSLLKEGWVIGEGTGLYSHPVHGWRGEYHSMDVGLESFSKKVSHVDAIVWTCLFGFKNKLTEGTVKWTRFITSQSVKQVAVIHDTHINSRGLWMTALEPYISGWVCVHKTGFDRSAGVFSPRTLIYNGHSIDENYTPDKKEKSLFSCQTFKPCKRVGRLVAAAPYILTEKIGVHLAGDGIEGRYMRSVDKCKPVYMCTRKTDPEAQKAMLGKRIWDNAIRSGMQYHGPVSEQKRNSIMKKCQFFVDMSLHKKGTGFINRTAVEAIKFGTIPILVRETIFGDGVAPMLAEGEDYFSIDSEEYPRNTAQKIVNYFKQTSPSVLKEMRVCGMKKIQVFNRKNKAKELVLFLQGNPAGTIYSPAIPNKELKTKAVTEFNAIFGDYRSSRHG